MSSPLPQPRHLDVVSSSGRGRPPSGATESVAQERGRSSGLSIDDLLRAGYWALQGAAESPTSIAPPHRTVGYNRPAGIDQLTFRIDLARERIGPVRAVSAFREDGP